MESRSCDCGFGTKGDSEKRTDIKNWFLVLQLYEPFEAVPSRAQLKQALEAISFWSRSIHTEKPWSLRFALNGVFECLCILWNDNWSKDEKREVSGGILDPILELLACTSLDLSLETNNLLIGCNAFRLLCLVRTGVYHIKTPVFVSESDCRFSDMPELLRISQTTYQ